MSDILCVTSRSLCREDFLTRLERIAAAGPVDFGPMKKAEHRADTTGQLDNPAELVIAENQAILSVQLLVQLRDRALDAYSEVMRISM